MNNNIISLFTRALSMWWLLLSVINMLIFFLLAINQMYQFIGIIGIIFIFIIIFIIYKLMSLLIYIAIPSILIMPYLLLHAHLNILLHTIIMIFWYIWLISGLAIVILHYLPTKK